MMNIYSLVLLISLLLESCIDSINSQTCLTNPPAVTHNPENDGDIEWTEIEDGVYHTTIVFDVKHYKKEETGTLSFCFYPFLPYTYFTGDELSKKIGCNQNQHTQLVDHLFLCCLLVCRCSCDLVFLAIGCGCDFFFHFQYFDIV